MARFKVPGAVSLVFVLGVSAWAQSSVDQGSAAESRQEKEHKPGAAREIGAGAGTAGVGAAKGAGAVAKGTGKGTVDLVTLHPINAATSLGKGAAAAGKDVTVGTVKGTGKVTKGIGRALKHLF